MRYEADASWMDFYINQNTCSTSLEEKEEVGFGSLLYIGLNKEGNNLNLCCRNYVSNRNW